MFPLTCAMKWYLVLNYILSCLCEMLTLSYIVYNVFDQDESRLYYCIVYNVSDQDERHSYYFIVYKFSDQDKSRSHLCIV